MLKALPLTAVLFLTAITMQQAQAQANTKLSNLVAPTAVNVDLLPNSNNAHNLGSGSFGWKSIYTTGGYYINSGLFLHNRGRDNTFVGDSVGTKVILDASTDAGRYNTGMGDRALFSLTKGTDNTAIGYKALFADTSGSYNTASGVSALQNNTTGFRNTANGHIALYSNTTGYNNTASGATALYSNTTGNSNTASGYSALSSNTTGHHNTAIGASTLSSNTTGYHNTANGYFALYANTTGYRNTASGLYALRANTTGRSNTASGADALEINTTGQSNTAIGASALLKNTTGYSNTASGVSALQNNTTGFRNTANGLNALYRNTTGTENTALGYFADVTVGTLVNATAIGSYATVDASNKVRIGNTSVTKIGGQVGWSTFSDGRFKKSIKQDVQGLSFINSLNPVTYTVDIQGLNTYYNKGKKELREEGDASAASIKEAEAKASKIIYSGFVAQEVEEAAKKLNYQFSGVDKPENKEGLYGLKYAEFVVPLVKAVQELDSANNAKDKRIAELELRLTKLETLLITSNGTLTTTSAYLEQNSPNPVSGSTVIRYRIPTASGSAHLTLTNAKGQLIKTINLSNRGVGQISLNTTMLAAGAYHYTLFVDGRQADVKRLVITK